MSSQEKKESVWSGPEVDSETIAKILFDLSGGDKRVLATSSRKAESVKSIWGQAIKKLFPLSRNTERDRFILYRFWKNKRKGVEGHFDKLCGKKSRLTIQPRCDKSKTDKACICESCYQPENNDRRVQCDNCTRWVHSLCLNVSIDNYEGDKSFTCKLCKGELKIPSVLDETQSPVDKPGIVHDYISSDSDDIGRPSTNDSLDLPSIHSEDDDDFKPPRASSRNFCLSPELNETQRSSNKGHDTTSSRIRLIETPPTKPIRKQNQKPAPKVTFGFLSRQVNQEKPERCGAANARGNPEISLNDNIKKRKSTEKKWMHTSSTGGSTNAMNQNNNGENNFGLFSSSQFYCKSSDDESESNSDSESGPDGKKVRVREKIIAHEEKFIQQPQLESDKCQASNTESRNVSRDIDDKTGRTGTKERDQEDQESKNSGSEIIEEGKDSRSDITPGKTGRGNARKQTIASCGTKNMENEDCTDGGSADGYSSGSSEKLNAERKTKKYKKRIEQTSNTESSDNDSHPHDSLFSNGKSRKERDFAFERKPKCPQRRKDQVPRGLNPDVDFSNLHGKKDNLHGRKGGKGQPNVHDKRVNSDEDLKSDKENEEPLDCSKVKKRFTIELSLPQWEQIIFLKQGKRGLKKTDYEVPRGYTNVLSNQFDKINKMCTMSFMKKKVGDPLTNRGPFFIAYSKCSNPTCSAKWKFVVDDKPKKGDKVKVRVIMMDGQICHYRNRPSARRWTGDVRAKAKKVLENKKPAAARMEFVAQADMSAVRNGRLTEIKTVKAFQMMKAEMVKARDLDKDVVQDTIKTKKMLLQEFDDKIVPGWVQDIQISPVKVTLFSFKQMEILKLLQNNQPVELFLDATETNDLISKAKYNFPLARLR